MKKQLPIISGTFGAFTSHFSILILLIISFAIFDAVIFQSLLSYLGMDTTQQLITAGGINVQQSELLKLILGMQGATLVGRIIILGPIFGAIIVYAGRGYAEKKKTSLYGSINFSLSRYKRLFLPNLYAQLAIQIGMLIIIPGVLSWMQFAFVESVACLEDEKHVLTRSKRLTKGRRKSIFLVILPWIFFSQIFGIIELYASTISFAAIVMSAILMEGLLAMMLLAFYMLYHNRITLLEAKLAERQKRLAEKSDEQELDAESNTDK